jgi:hypothetical protein
MGRVRSRIVALDAAQRRSPRPSPIEARAWDTFLDRT